MWSKGSKRLKIKKGYQKTLKIIVFKDMFKIKGKENNKYTKFVIKSKINKTKQSY